MFWYWFLIYIGISLIITIIDHILFYIVWILDDEKGKTLGDFYRWIERDQGWYWASLLWIPFLNFVTLLIVIIYYYIGGGCSYLLSKFENLHIR